MAELYLSVKIITSIHKSMQINKSFKQIPFESLLTDKVLITQLKFITKVQSLQLTKSTKQSSSSISQAATKHTRRKGYMIRKILKTGIIKANITRLFSCKFSSNDPKPDQNPNDQNRKAQDTKGEANTIKTKPSYTYVDQKQAKQIRSQARLKVCRSQLGKFAKAQSDYQRLNNPSQLLQKMTKKINDSNLKIKFHTQHGTRLQFYRSQQASRKPSAKKQETQQKNTNQKDEKAKNQASSTKESQKIQPQQDQVSDSPIEMKILTSGIRQMPKEQGAYFQAQFTQEQSSQEGTFKQFTQKIISKNTEKASTVNNPKWLKKGFMKFEMKGKHELNKIFKGPNNITGKFSFQVITPQQSYEDQSIGKFKEFTVYLRNKENASLNEKGEQKWVKANLMVQDWQNVHLYSLEIVSNIQAQISGRSQLLGTDYRGVQAKQLDPILLSLLIDCLQQVQELTPKTLASIYYYTSLYEHQFYRRWLEDIIDVCK